MIGFLLLAPILFLATLMSMFAGVMAMMSAVLTLIMGMVGGAVTVSCTALLGVMILIFS
jgi:hypothetical protein